MIPQTVPPSSPRLGLSPKQGKRKRAYRLVRMRQQRGAKRRPNDNSFSDVGITELLAQEGWPTVIATQIIRQALEDLTDAHAGKKFNPSYYCVRGYDPLGELRDFFASEWFAFIADHLGIDPAFIIRIAMPRNPAGMATIPADTCSKAYARAARDHVESPPALPPISQALTPRIE